MKKKMLILLIAGLVLSNGILVKTLINKQETKSSTSYEQIENKISIEKINKILEQNKLNVLDLDINFNYNESIVDVPKHSVLNIFGKNGDKIRAFLKEKTLYINSDVHFCYTYDLSKVNVVKLNDDKYLINLKIQDLDLFVNNKVISSDVKMSMLSTYFTPEQVFNIEQNMLEKAKENIDEDNKFKTIALENTKKNLYDIFEKVGIEDNVYINMNI